MVVEEEQKMSLQELEKPEKQGQEHPRTEASSGQPPLEVQEMLVAMQVQLSSMDEKGPKAYLGLQKGHQRRKLTLTQRSAIFQGILVFWAKAESLLLLRRGQMLRRRRNRSRMRGGGEGTSQLWGGQGNWEAREFGAGGVMMSTGTVQTEHENFSNCLCLTK